MKKESKEITVGKASKYTKVRFSAARILVLYREGKNVAEIALAIGYPPNCGQNRTRRVLEQAGIYKRTAKQNTKKHKGA